MSHTPGPWYVDSVLGDYKHEVCIDRHDIGCPIILANVFYDNHQDEKLIIGAAEAEANARLIAAAPELLDCLVEARERMLGSGKAITELREKTDAAIAKAKGQL